MTVALAYGALAKCINLSQSKNTNLVELRFCLIYNSRRKPLDSSKVQLKPSDGQCVVKSK